MENKFYKLGEYDNKTDLVILSLQKSLEASGIKPESISFNPRTMEAEVNGQIFKVPCRIAEVAKALKNKEK